MLPEDLVPTPLIRSDEWPAIVITAPDPSLHFRSLRIVIVLLGLVVRLGWWRLSRRYDPKKAGLETRRRLEQLGGMWIKVGQLLSLRVDLFSNEFWAELSRLQDHAHGFLAAKARATVEEDLGGAIENFFSEFDPEPFAAASTAQVHRARLLDNGVEVAVKVRRPEIEGQIESEMKLLGRIVWVLETFGIASFLHWNAMKKELQQIMLEEIDFRYEASTISRIARTLKKHRVYVPEVFKAVCTKRVLVTELLRGVLMSDYINMLGKDPARVAAWREENDIDPDRIGHRLLFSLLRQIFEDNLYHGDLHPGNIMLLRNNRAALIDLGAVGFTDKEFLGRYHLFLRSVGELDFAKAADALLLLGDNVPIDNLDPLRTELIRVLRNWSLRTHASALPFHDRSISMVSTKLLQILASAEVTPDWSFLRIRRAEHTLDASIIHLVPDVNYSKIAKRYFRGYDRRRLERFVVNGPARVATGVIDAVEMGDHAIEQTLFTASVVRRDALVLEASISKFSYIFVVLFTQFIIALVLAGVVSLICFMHQHPVAGISALTEPLYFDLFDVVPQLSPSSWLLILFGDAYLVWIAWRLRSRLTKSDGSMRDRRTWL
ncbi:MAG TPA: AarF/ABC1/UbiB kinase family protein [Bradyrhizobium sp.]|nr:AarF/ABC1/UbiB kinase family protein [Bradyrhizobium sp.]